MVVPVSLLFDSIFYYFFTLVAALCFRPTGFAWKKVSPACKDFIQALLARDEALRPPTGSLLAHPWFAEYTLIHQDGGWG